MDRVELVGKAKELFQNPYVRYGAYGLGALGTAGLGYGVYKGLNSSNQPNSDEFYNAQVSNQQRRKEGQAPRPENQQYQQNPPDYQRQHFERKDTSKTREQALSIADEKLNQISQLVAMKEALRLEKEKEKNLEQYQINEKYQNVMQGYY